MTVWRRRDDWVGAQIEDSFVMINVESGRYVSLNESAADAWEALEQPRDEAALVDALVARYDVDPAACAASVARLLERMQGLELIAAEG